MWLYLVFNWLYGLGLGKLWFISCVTSSLGFGDTHIFLHSGMLNCRALTYIHVFICDILDAYKFYLYLRFFTCEAKTEIHNDPPFVQ